MSVLTQSPIKGPLPWRLHCLIEQAKERGDQDAVTTITEALYEIDTLRVRVDEQEKAILGS